MILSTFMFTVATTICKASGDSGDASLSQPHTKGLLDVAASLSTGLISDQAVWDALVEAILALTVFGAASAFLRIYRRNTSKKLGPHQKSMSGQSRPLPPAMPKSSCGLPHAGSEQASCQRPPPGLVLPRRETAKKPTLTSEADALANAVRAGKAEQLPRLLDIALSGYLIAASHQGAQVSEEEVASQLLLSAIRACAAARCFKEAIAAYDHMAMRIGSSNANLCSVLLYCIVEASAFHRCKRVFEHLCKQASPSAHDFVNMVRCYAGQHAPAGLREVLSGLRTLGYSIDVYTWNRALAACGASESVLDLAEELAAAGLCEEGMDAVGYNTLMKFNARAGRLSRCFELRTEMFAKGLEPSEVTFGILLDACVGAKEIDHARKVFDDLCSSGLQLNVVHCTSFIKCLVGARRFDEAAGVLSEMVRSPGVKPDLIAYSTVVKGYADNGDTTSALKLLEQMLAEAVKPDEIIFNNVLTGCCNFPTKSETIMHIFATLIDRGMRPSTTTLSILIKGLMITDDWSTSLQVLQDAPKSFGLEPEMRLYAQLAQGCIKARKTRAILDVFEVMLHAADRHRKPLDKAAVNRIFRSCLSDCTAVGRIFRGCSPNEPEVAAGLQRMAQRAGVVIDSQVEKILQAASAQKASAA